MATQTCIILYENTLFGGALEPRTVQTVGSSNRKEACLITFNNVSSNFPRIKEGRNEAKKKQRGEGGGGSHWVPGFYVENEPGAWKKWTGVMRENWTEIMLPLECNVNHVSPNENTKYISYVWPRVAVIIVTRGHMNKQQSRWCIMPLVAVDVAKACSQFSDIRCSGTSSTPQNATWRSISWRFFASWKLRFMFTASYRSLHSFPALWQT